MHGRRQLARGPGPFERRPWETLLAAALAALFLAACSGGGHPPGPGSSPPPRRQVVVSGARWDSSGPLGPAAVAVLTAAFDTDHRPGEPEANAYDFAATGGDRGMDWWNFPWDLPSSRNQYTLTYQDMEAMLGQVTVQAARDAPERVRYARMLANMVDSLTPAIMNAHGGHLRVIKILYCVRNFLAVAKAHPGLAGDVAPLAEAARKLLALEATGQLADGPSPYTRDSSYRPRDPGGIPEDRTRSAAVHALRRLLELP